MQAIRTRPRVDAATHRKRDLASIHMLAGKLGLDTADKAPSSDYRTMLQSVGSASSAADLDEAGRRRVLAHLRKAAGVAERPKDGWHAEHIRKLWRQLGDVGALQDPSEAGLNNFVRRMTGLASPRFLASDKANQVVEGLKAWLARAQAAKKGGVTA